MMHRSHLHGFQAFALAAAALAGAAGASFASAFVSDALSAAAVAAAVATAAAAAILPAPSEVHKAVAAKLPVSVGAVFSIATRALPPDASQCRLRASGHAMRHTR